MYLVLGNAGLLVEFGVFYRSMTELANEVYSSSPNETLSWDYMLEELDKKSVMGKNIMSHVRTNLSTWIGEFYS